MITTTPTDQHVGQKQNYEKYFSRAWFRSTDLWVMGPARFHCATLLSSTGFNWEMMLSIRLSDDANAKKRLLSEVGFEPTPTEVDCDLNAAP